MCAVEYLLIQQNWALLISLLVYCSVQSLRVSVKFTWCLYCSQAVYGGYLVMLYCLQSKNNDNCIIHLMGPQSTRYEPIVRTSDYRLKEPIMKILYGAKERPSRVQLLLCQKWTDLDEIWNNVSQMLAAVPGRFWERSEQQQQFERQPKFFFCLVNNARFRRFPVGKILPHFNTTTLVGEAVKTFGTEFWKFYHKELFFEKTQKLLTKFPGLATSGHHNSAMITDRKKLTSKWSLYVMSGFHFYHYNHF